MKEAEENPLEKTNLGLHSNEAKSYTEFTIERERVAEWKTHRLFIQRGGV